MHGAMLVPYLTYKPFSYFDRVTTKTIDPSFKADEESARAAEELNAQADAVTDAVAELRMLWLGKPKLIPALQQMQSRSAHAGERGTG
jgi:hypothetical protein